MEAGVVVETKAKRLCGSVTRKEVCQLARTGTYLKPTGVLMQSKPPAGNKGLFCYI